tara:strand:- start:71 stop:268 length:198 start_codon:yes stop_codon:yes gene_type:complete
MPFPEKLKIFPLCTNSRTLKPINKLKKTEKHCIKNINIKNKNYKIAIKILSVESVVSRSNSNRHN